MGARKKQVESSAKGTTVKDRESDEVAEMRLEMQEILRNMSEEGLRAVFNLRNGQTALEKSIDDWSAKITQRNEATANSCAVPFDIHDDDFDLPPFEEPADYQSFRWGCKEHDVAMAALRAGFTVSIVCPPNFVAQGVSLILPVLDGKCRGFYEPGTRRLFFKRDNEPELSGVCSYCDRDWGRDGCPCKCAKCRK